MATSFHNTLDYLSRKEWMSSLGMASGLLNIVSAHVFEKTPAVHPVSAFIAAFLSNIGSMVLPDPAQDDFMM